MDSDSDYQPHEGTSDEDEEYEKWSGEEDNIIKPKTKRLKFSDKTAVLKECSHEAMNKVKYEKELTDQKKEG